MRLTYWFLVVLLATAVTFGARGLLTPAPTAATATPDAALDPTTNDAERLIRVFEERVDERTDYPDAVTLGGLYLSRAERTGNLSDYGLALTTLDAVVDPAGRDQDAIVTLARVKLALHRFENAADLARRAIAIDPQLDAAHAAAGDAQLALGDVEAASTHYLRLERRGVNDPAVTIRRAQLAWTTGDVIAATSLAAEATAGARELGIEGRRLGVFVATHGRYLLSQGAYDDAIAALEAGPAEPAVQFVLAAALAATDDLDGAIRTMESAVTALPDPPSLALLEELYIVAGRHDDARATAAALEAAATLDASGVYDRAIALWLSDHDRQPDRALELALSDPRLDPGAHDVRAWALYRSGRWDDARKEADLALASGIQEPSIWFHSGLIWLALGDLERARSDLALALETSPRFSPTFAGEAGRLLEELAR